MSALCAHCRYVELCSHFFVLCPPVQHNDNGSTCDLASWLDRGWCRAEQLALYLSRRTDRLPPILIQGSSAQLSMLSLQQAISHVPGMGKFTCCARNHVIGETATASRVASRATSRPLGQW